MITLITGTPGAGKTLYSLRYLKDFLNTYRYVYVHGITGLVLPHEVVVCESKTCDFCQSLKDYDSYKKVKDWNRFADDGSVFFIDECQHIYRSKGSMSVTEFETHRHRGLEFYIVTQHPMLINTDLRRLVGRHIHLVADFLGRRQYEWVECSQNLSKTNAIKSRYNLDKSLFALYQSATIHTKQHRKFPFVVFIMLLAVLVGVYSVYSFYKRKIANRNMQASQSVKIENEIETRVIDNKVTNDKNALVASSSFENDLESLPESTRWHLVHRISIKYNIEKGYSETVFVLDADTYEIEDVNNNRRVISAKKCRVVDFDLICIVGHQLVAAWTGQEFKRVGSVSSDVLNLVSK